MTDQEREELDGLALRAAKTIKDYCEKVECRSCCFYRPDKIAYRCGLKGIPDAWEVDDD